MTAEQDRIATSETAAEGAPFQVHAEALRRFFRRRIDHASVEDCVQDVFVRIEARRGVAPIENPEAYLFAVARSVLILHGRAIAAGRKKHDQLSDLDGEQVLADAAPDAERRLIAKDELGRVLDAIEQLPDKTRHVFTMHRFEDRTYAQIASDLSMSVSAVEKHIMEALRRLLLARRS